MNAADEAGSAKPKHAAPRGVESGAVPRMGLWAARGRALALRTWQWLKYQVREIGRELKRAIRPPVRVRPQGKHALAISARQEFGGRVVLLPLGGRGLVAVDRVAADGGVHKVVIRAGDTPGGDTWSVGAFPDLDTAMEAVAIIRKPLTGSAWGKWVWRVLLLWLALILLRTWFNGPNPDAAAAAAGIDPARAAAPGPATATSALMGLFGDRATPGLAALAAGAEPGAGYESLADEIYEEAMAKAKASAYEQGPPQSPVPDVGLKGFGLSGGASGAGCDPKLAFKVDP